MPNWRRAHGPGGTYFFTVVTDPRQPVFSETAGRKLLGNLLRECRKQWPFSIHSIVLLPDHLHTIWTLPRGDGRYSQRWAWIKRQFTKRWLAGGGAQTRISTGRERDGRRGVWQPKFWEHCIEEKIDMERHVDDIHDNPVKHGHDRCPADWPWSSFHRWVKHEAYAPQWGCAEQSPRYRIDDSEDSAGV